MTEGPFVGSNCLACLGGQWVSAAIRAAYADGTFRIELEPGERPRRLLAGWYGVTRSELCFNDVAMWSAAREALALPARFGRREFERVVGLHEPGAPSDAVAKVWSEAVKTLFGVASRAAASYTAGPDDAYRLIVHAGFSAGAILERSRGLRQEPTGRIYWNQIRMGGRSVQEVGRTITVEDALGALGLAPPATCPPGELPQALRRYYAGLRNDPGAPVDERSSPWPRNLSTVHPCDPALLEPTENVYRGLRARGLDGELGAGILAQDPFEWVAVFDPGDADARIYVQRTVASKEGAEDWREVAPSVGFFFWDVAQSGLAWWTENPSSRLTVRIGETDVGYAIAR